MHYDFSLDRPSNNYNMVYSNENRNPNIYQNNQYQNNCIPDIPGYCAQQYSRMYNNHALRNNINLQNQYYNQSQQNYLKNQYNRLLLNHNPVKPVRIQLNTNSQEFIPSQINESINQKTTKYTNDSKNQKNLPNYSEMTEEYLANNVYSFAKDQIGCRFLQRKIEENALFGNEIIFPKIKSHLTELSNDSFGNYLIQKVLEYLNEDNLYEFLNIVIQMINLDKA